MLTSCRFCKRPVPSRPGLRVVVCDAPACTARLTSRDCPICGAGLSVHQQARGCCDGPDCQREHYARRDAARRAAEQAALDAAARSLHESAAAALDLPTDALHLATVRGNDRDLLPRDPARIARLRAHLEGLREDADGVYVVSDVALSSDPRVAKVSAVACTACRGGCCVAGSEKAYLKADTLARYLTASGASVDEAMEHYVARVPERTYADSCIYHGPEGCGLPREMRSDTCNDHLCAGLKRLRREVASGIGAPILVVALCDREPSRTDLIQEL